MNWLAIDVMNLFRCHWIQGCMMILVFFWAFLALLGIRSARFPWRILGGLSFVIGSTLWLGLHPGIEFDTGELGRIVQHSLAGRISSSFALSGLSALLLVCSLIGLLVAIDWLPLLPFAPMLARADERRDGPRLAGVPTDFVSPKVDRPDDDLALARAASAAVAPRVRKPAAAPVPAAPAAPPLPPARTEPPATLAVVAPPTAPVVPPLPAVETPAPTPVAAAPAAAARDENDDVDELADSGDSGDDAPTNWARFRPRSRAEDDTTDAESSAETSDAESLEIGDELAVDKGAPTSHNSSTPEGESRAVEDDALALADAPADSSDATQKKEDTPVLDRDQDPTEGAPDGALAVAEQHSEASAEALAGALAETLAPRRKKEEEPEEKPEKEDDEEGEEEEGDEEDFDDEDSEEEDEDEEFEEEDDDKEEDKEEEEEEEEEDWDDDEKEEDDEDEDDDDEDWDDDDDEKEDEDDDDDDEEEKGGDEESSRTEPPPSAEVAVEPVEASAVELAPAEEVPTAASDDAVEILAGDSDGPPAPAHAPARDDVAKILFPDLPEEDRTVLVRAVDLIAGSESVSLSRLQRELGITYYSAARVFERLEKEGFLAPYTGSLARAVRITREEWTALQSDGGSG